MQAAKGSTKLCMQYKQNSVKCQEKKIKWKYTHTFEHDVFLKIIKSTVQKLNAFIHSGRTRSPEGRPGEAA